MIDKVTTLGAKKDSTQLIGRENEYIPWNDTVKEAVDLEKEIIRVLAGTMKLGIVFDEVIEGLGKQIERYACLLFRNVEMTYHERIESMKRILRFLLKYPVKNNVDILIVERLLNEFSLINMLTFCISQFCSDIIGTKTIDDYIEYVKGTSLETLSVLFLFRMNHEYVRQKYPIDDISILTEEELYYGVTTGYFKYSDLAPEAINRLKEISAINELELLKRDGFRI